VVSPATNAFTMGYWKNHSEKWPTALNFTGVLAVFNPTASGYMSLGGISYTKAKLLTILGTPTGTGTGADARLILTDQMIAAILNIATGAAHSSTTDATLVDGNTLLTGQGTSCPALGRSVRIPRWARRWSMMGRT